MKNYFLGASILFSVVALGSGFSKTMGWYNEYWYTDIILHTISGIAFGMIWLGMNVKNKISSLFIVGIGSVSFAVFGSVLWEFWEFAGWRITPSQTPFYIPELGDTLLDIVCGLIGGIVSALMYLYTKRHLLSRK